MLPLTSKLTIDLVPSLPKLGRCIKDLTDLDRTSSFRARKPV